MELELVLESDLCFDSLRIFFVFFLMLQVLRNLKIVKDNQSYKFGFTNVFPYLPYKCELCSLDLVLLLAVISGLSTLGFESVGDPVTPSSDPALLLLLPDARMLFD